MNAHKPGGRESHRTNPFLAKDVAARYEAWYFGAGRRADMLEKRLLRRLLESFGRVDSVLEIGCGTGHFTRWMRSFNYYVVGLDSSPAMLAEAVQLNEGDYVQADAGLLPFQDNAFDITTMITTLEFVSEPERVLREAVRVSRFGLLLGVMNRHSLLALSYRRSSNPLWRDARFFTTRELIRMIETATDGNSAKITWRTTLWPHPCSCALRLPWGGFIGVAAHWPAS